ncbi:hypothetical protein ACI48J_07775 [Paenibacillus chitinolyticus]|uniref:hypothetical protein n=1 Tax=Paenibacillus chitinolyticus TaxID=79263 RepID=UPI00386410E7
MNVLVRTKEMMKLLSNQVMEIPSAKSEVEFRLLDGRTEFFELSSTGPIEFKFETPVSHDNGETTIDLEILKFEVEATSKVLWPGQQVKMSGGRNIRHEALPIRGRVVVPEGKDLMDGVESIQDVYIQIETPSGTFHNTEAIQMTGSVTGIPPVDVTFRSSTVTKIYDENMERQMDVYGCASTTPY